MNGDTGETEEDVAMFNKGARYKISCYRTDSDNAKLPLYTDGKSPSIAAGTEFVILNIVMPESYVTMAENTLEKAALDYLSRYDHENRTVSLDISSGFVAEHPNLFIDFIEGNMLKVSDDGIGVFYFSDNGILSLFLDRKESVQLENMVAVALARAYPDDVYYLKSAKTNIDIDFYVPSVCLAVQAAYSIEGEARAREVGNLKKLAKNSQECTRFIIVTYEEEETRQGSFLGRLFRG